MAENEIPNSGPDHLSNTLIYRVTFVATRIGTELQQHPNKVHMMDFNNGSLWDRKENALRYLTAQLAKMDVSTYNVNDQTEHSSGVSVMLSLVKTGPNGSEEEFFLIGGTEAQMLDAQLEEEIAFAIQRTSGLY